MTLLLLARRHGLYLAQQLRELFALVLARDLETAAQILQRAAFRLEQQLFQSIDAGGMVSIGPAPDQSCRSRGMRRIRSPRSWTPRASSSKVARRSAIVSRIKFELRMNGVQPAVYGHLEFADARLQQGDAGVVGALRVAEEQLADLLHFFVGEVTGIQAVAQFGTGRGVHVRTRSYAVQRHDQIAASGS